MKDKQQAHNLQCGRIYINAKSNEPMRLISVLPSEGVWMETYDGQGYGHTIKFKDVLYASLDEVQDFLEDLRVYKGDQLSPVPEFIHPFDPSLNAPFPTMPRLTAVNNSPLTSLRN